MPDTTGDEQTAPIVYETRPTVQNAALVGLQGGGVGVLVASVQNALEHHNRGAMGILTRSGGTIGFFAAMGATFAFTDSYVANLRAKEDALNGAAGGCAAGLLAGARARSIPLAVASCAVLGAMVGTFDAAGRNLTGDGREAEPRLSREERRRRFFKHDPPVQAASSPS